MIGAVLHLMGRVVDRAKGADVASLRVKVAALSARVVAAEGEVERLRGERSRQVSWRGVAVALEREAAEARAEVERLTREQGELRQRFHEVLRELGQTRVSAHATAEYAGKAEQLRHEVDELRRLVRAYKAAEDAFFEADGNVAILGADNAMEAAKRDLFAAIPKETP